MDLHPISVEEAPNKPTDKNLVKNTSLHHTYASKPEEGDDAGANGFFRTYLKSNPRDAALIQRLMNGE